MSKRIISEKKVYRKVKKGFLEVVFSRIGITILLLMLQLFLFICVYLFLIKLLPFTLGLMIMASAIMTIYMANTDKNPSIKVAWIIRFVIVPVLSIPLYFYVKNDLGFRWISRHYKNIEKELEPYILFPVHLMSELKNTNRELYNIAMYTSNCGNFPVYENTSVEYFPSGEEKMKELLIQLEKAEKFILLEYFIIENGYMWSTILDVLKKKVQNGVEVRVMYDGTCAFSKLPYSYPKKLKALGIKAKMFAPIRPFFSTYYNNRDHRKILVIDGKTAFTGGINLADEYLNINSPVGHWKDTAIMLKGNAVRNFTAMFLHLWNIDNRNHSENYQLYLPSSIPTTKKEKGYVIPFGDNPFDNNPVAKMVYLNMINQANHDITIMTPYLIIDEELENAICFAAHRGVNVNIILPSIPDNKIIALLRKNHYPALLKSGETSMNINQDSFMQKYVLAIQRRR